MELISVFTDPSFLSECLQCPGILITAPFFDYFDWTSHLERDTLRVSVAICCASTDNQAKSNCEGRRASQVEGICDHARVQHATGSARFDCCQMPQQFTELLIKGP